MNAKPWYLTKTGNPDKASRKRLRRLARQLNKANARAHKVQRRQAAAWAWRPVA